MTGLFYEICPVCGTLMQQTVNVKLGSEEVVCPNLCVGYFVAIDGTTHLHVGQQNWQFGIHTSRDDIQNIIAAANAAIQTLSDEGSDL